MFSFNVKKLVFSAMSIAIAIVSATLLKIKGPFWFNGGSITLFSMFFVCIVGYWYGPVVGIASSLAYSLLQMITGLYVVHPLQVILDYPLAFGALGLSGFFYKKKNGLLIGYIVGVFGRLVFHCISGFIFYTEYVGNTKANIAAAWGSAVYNMSYIVPEAVITIIILSIPAVKKGIEHVTRMATTDSNP